MCYRVPCIIYATAYVNAENHQEALHTFNRNLRNQCIETTGSLIRSTAEPDDYDAMLSPAMTIGDAEHEGDCIELVDEHGGPQIADTLDPGHRAKRAPDAFTATLFPLNAKQSAALLRFASLHGMRWKSTLLRLWANGRDAYEPDGPLLRQIRHALGPSGLLRLRIPKEHRHDTV